MADVKPASPEAIKLFRGVEDVAPLFWEKLLAIPPQSAAKNSGARFEAGRGFLVPFMNGEYLVEPRSRSIETPPGHKPAGFQKALVLLSYLIGAQDIGLSGKMVTSRDLNGGAMFFAGPHTLLTEPVTQKFAGRPEAFVERAKALGFAQEALSGGFAVMGPILPHIAVGLILYPEDDEFPASLTYTFDSYAHHHLPLDAIWAMINVLAEEF